MTYENFKVEVLRLTGIDLSYYKENQMKRRIDALIKRNECNGYEDYLILIKTDATKLDKFIAYLTINVTEFYRNPAQWNVLENDIYPLILKKHKNIKIWSAACSTGDEPYSLAMTLAQHIPLSQIQILATDIDKEVLAKAKDGFYTERNIANLPKQYLNKYMEPYNGGYRVKEELKRCITFKQHNLLKDEYPKDMSLIVCRNVLIYFTEDAKNYIYRNFNRALANDGVLFVGSTEQIISHQDYGFKSGKIFFYEKERTV